MDQNYVKFAFKAKVFPSWLKIVAVIHIKRVVSLSNINLKLFFRRYSFKGFQIDGKSCNKLPKRLI